MIDFATDRPLAEAVKSLGKRTPLGTMLSSAEWERVPLEIRDVSFWSSRVTEERILAEAKRRILQAVRMERDAAEAGGRVMERGRFVLEMQDILRQLGYQPDPEKAGGLQDLSSSRRLSLIWQMNLDMAAGAARHKARQNDVSLRRAPAMELVRGAERIERRDWPRIWAAEGGKFYGEPGPDYPNAPGRMIALVTDGIWRRISRFGVPWSPFDWGSGMVERVIRRRAALALRSVPDGEPLLRESDPAQTPESFSLGEGVQASVKGVEIDGRERLRSDFGDSIRFDDDTVYQQRDITDANEHREKTIREELAARARSAVERGEEALGELRRNDDAAGALFGSAEADGVRRGWLAQISAVANGRKQLFHENISEEAARPLIAAVKAIDSDVRAEWKDGHLLVWRDDIVPLGLDQLVELSGENPVARNGLLLGYGLESPASESDHALVIISGPDGEAAAGFHAPLGSAPTFAAARLRDFTDAFGAAAGFSAGIFPRKGGRP